MKINSWQNADNEIIKELPYQVAEWLLEFGSLTEKLSSNLKGDVKLDLLREKYDYITANESEILKLEKELKVKIREVVLYGPIQPWIYARTVVPIDSAYLIEKLGNKPLGSILFSGQSMRRESLQLRTIDKDHSLFISANKQTKIKDTDFLWARRSLWSSSNKLQNLRLVVTEVFLPDSPLYR